jgi:hypothetical protein
VVEDRGRYEGSGSRELGSRDMWGRPQIQPKTTKRDQHILAKKEPPLIRRASPDLHADPSARKTEMAAVAPTPRGSPRMHAAPHRQLW